MTLHLNLISEEEWKQSRDTPWKQRMEKSKQQAELARQQGAERITKLEKERSKGRHKIFCKIANPAAAAAMDAKIARLKSEAVAAAKQMVGRGQDRWRRIVDHEAKWINSHWVSHLQTIVVPLKKNYNGHFFYDRVKHTPHKCNVWPCRSVKRELSVSETSPIFQLFSLHSNTFTHVHTDDVKFQQLEYWKSSSIDDNIVDTIKQFNLNKYEVGPNEDVEYNNYILFSLQSTEEHFDKRLFVDVIKWSKNNKRTIVLKLHPYTDANSYIFTLLKKLKEANLLEYIKVASHLYNINTLIDQCDKVWMFNSGVALNAILRGKPTATFMNSEYNPMSLRCSSPEQADLITYPSEDLLYRYLSWFYHRYTINIGADTAVDRFTQLFDHYYRDQKSLESYMNMNWK